MLGVPAYALFGGPVRDRIRLCWSHCATYRVSRAREMELPPVNAYFSAVVSDLRIMEIDSDMVLWQGDLVTVKPEIKDGHLVLPAGPGWGPEVNEDAVHAHPPRAGRR